MGKIFLLIILFLAPFTGKAQQAKEKQADPVSKDTSMSLVTHRNLYDRPYQWRSQPETQVDSIYRHVWHMETPEFSEQRINHGRDQRQPVVPADK